MMAFTAGAAGPVSPPVSPIRRVVAGAAVVVLGGAAAVEVVGAGAEVVV